MWPNNKSTWSADEQFAYNCECIKYWKACKNWSNSKSKSIYMQSDKGPVKSLQKWKRCNPRPSRWDRADLLLAVSRPHQYYYKIYFTLSFFFFQIVWKNFLPSPNFSLSPAVSFLFPYLVKLFRRKQLLFLLMIWCRILEFILLILQAICSGPERISVIHVTTMLENIIGQGKRSFSCIRVL